MGVFGKLFKKKPKGTPSSKDEAPAAEPEPTKTQDAPVAAAAAPEEAAALKAEPAVAKDAAPTTKGAAATTEEVIVMEVALAPADAAEPVATGAADVPDAAETDGSVEVVKGSSAAEIVPAPAASAIAEAAPEPPALATPKKEAEAVATAPAPAAALPSKGTKVISLKLKAGWNVKGVKVELRAVGARRPSVFENIGGALRKSVTDLGSNIGQLFSPRGAEDDKSRAASPPKTAPPAALPDEQLLRAFASRVQTAWEQGDIDLFGELCAPGVVFTVPSADVSASGVQDIWAAREKLAPIGLLSFSSIMASASKTSGVVVSRETALTASPLAPPRVPCPLVAALLAVRSHAYTAAPTHTDGCLRPS